MQTAGRLRRQCRSHTVSAWCGYWMDASRTDGNNPRHAERISHRKTERRVWPIHLGFDMLRMRPRAKGRAAHARSAMWLGCSSRGYRQAYALLKMRQEALQASRICAEEAARIHIVAEMNSCERLQA